MNEEEMNMQLRQLFSGKKAIASGSAIPKHATVYSTDLPILGNQTVALYKLGND